MPMDRSLYPPNWEEIATAVKNEANWKCEECGRPCRMPGESYGDLYERIEYQHQNWAGDLYGEDEIGEPTLKLNRFILTVAHLNHNPPDCDRSNLKALCSVCHLRYDSQFYATKKRLKRERLGQLRLEGV